MFHVEQLILHRKTGFKNLFPYRPVVIRDFRGIVFYSTEGLKPVEYFNLPEGNYFLDKGDIHLLDKPNPVKIMPMPRAERNMPDPFNFNVQFCRNINKCTIDWETRCIYFDESFKNMSLPNIYFVLYHEFGHKLYTTEKYADLYAANRMLQKGYNYSQIGMAPIEALGTRQLERKTFIINNLLK
jgi:hypothetical protein